MSKKEGLYPKRIKYREALLRQTRQKKSSALLLGERGPLGECVRSLPRLLGDFEAAVVRE